MAEKTPQETEFDKAKKYAGDTRSWMRTHYRLLRDAASRGDLAECRKEMDLFRKEQSKLPGVYARMKRALDAFVKMVSDGSAPGAAAALVFPGDLSGLADKGSAELDGAKMTRVVDASGQTWLRRTAGDAESGGKEQLESETAVDSVYATFGLGAPMSRMYGDEKLTQDVGGDSLVDFLGGSAPAAEKDAARKQFMDGLDVDCMLANWSCVGGNSDKRFCVIKDGKVYRTGSFGAMSYRVKGGKKGSSGWGADPTDFFKLWTFANQQAVLGSAKVNVLELMKRTQGRNWDSVKRMLPASDWKVIESRIENIGKIVEYGDELLNDDPGMDVDDLNEQLETFMTNGYKKPVKLTQFPADKSKKREVVQIEPLEKSVKTGSELKKVLGFRGDISGRRHELMSRMLHHTGGDGIPQIANSMEEFKKMSPYTMGYRTIGADSVAELQEMIRQLKDGQNEGDFYVQCSGGAAHGLGMYVATFNHTKPDAKRRAHGARADSNGYGGGNFRCEFQIGVTDDFKWISESDLGDMQYMEKDSELKSMNKGNYAVYLGYDGIYSNDYGGYTYSVIYNRSKCVILDKQKYLKN